MRLALTVPTLALLLIGIACPGPQYPNCKNDSQCKVEGVADAKGGVCVFGKCQECVADTDCGEGWLCQENKCVDKNAANQAATRCISSADCGEGYMCESGLCTSSGARSSDASGKCEMQGTLFFDFDKYDLKGDAGSWLDSFGQCLRDHPDWKVSISGHTDDLGSTEYNMSLGERRARSVVGYLSRLGLDEKRFHVNSYGEERPLDPAETDEARAKNRRGEIAVQ